MEGLLKEEITQWPELSIDEWNDEYQQIMNEMNEYLAKMLIESAKQDESHQYESYQNLLEKDLEEMASFYDQNNNDFYVCAICKRNVYRVQGSRVCCQRPDCINIDLGNENFKLEDLMHLVMKLVLDHRESCR